MKKRSAVLLSITGSTLLCVFLSGCSTAPIRGGKVHHGKLIDGIYEGSYRKGPNKAVVKVTIRNGEIENVEVVKRTASWIGKKADKIIPKRIVEHQSTDVDAVTGATNSSRVIMNAVHKALEEAYGKQKVYPR